MKKTTFICAALAAAASLIMGSCSSSPDDEPKDPNQENNSSKPSDEDIDYITVKKIEITGTTKASPLYGEDPSAVQWKNDSIWLGFVKANNFFAMHAGEGEIVGVAPNGKEYVVQIIVHPSSEPFHDAGWILFKDRQQIEEVLGKGEEVSADFPYTQYQQDNQKINVYYGKTGLAVRATAIFRNSEPYYTEEYSMLHEYYDPQGGSSVNGWSFDAFKRFKDMKKGSECDIYVQMKYKIRSTEHCTDFEVEYYDYASISQ